MGFGKNDCLLPHKAALSYSKSMLKLIENGEATRGHPPGVCARNAISSRSITLLQRADFQASHSPPSSLINSVLIGGGD
jgi:hypothetical protein